MHPFLDGNGRLSRILIPLFLYDKKLLDRPIFYLSEWLEERRDEYIDALRNLGTRPNSWNHWIEFFLRGVEEQAIRNTSRARAIMDLYEDMKRRILNLTRSQYAVPFLDQLFDRPVFQSTHLRFDTRVSKATITKILRTLERAEVIKVIRPGSGRRAGVYSFSELIAICEGRDESRIQTGKSIE